jgi:hypothetical protein
MIYGRQKREDAHLPEAAAQLSSNRCNSTPLSIARLARAKAPIAER